MRLVQAPETKYFLENKMNLYVAHAHLYFAPYKPKLTAFFSYFFNDFARLSYFILTLIVC